MDLCVCARTVVVDSTHMRRLCHTPVQALDVVVEESTNTLVANSGINLSIR